MAAEVRIIVSGEGNAAQVLQGVQQGVRGIGQEADRQSSGAKGFFSGVLQTAGGILTSNVLGFVTSQIGGIFTGGIADAREAAGVMAQTEAVIKSTGGAAGFTANQIADMAGALSAASGKSLFGDSDIQKGQNLLLTFTNIKETLPEATGVMVDMAQAMGTDVAGGAIQLGKALNDPVAGISALSRVGVTFSDDQKKVIESLVATGDVAGAQRVILAELNKEFGGSAQAAADASGGWDQMKDRLGEVAESVGGLLLPVLDQGVGFLNSAVLPAIEGMVASFASGGEASNQLGAVLGVLTGVWQALEPTITNVVSAVQNVVTTVFGQVQVFIQAHGDEIASFMTEAWSQIQEIITVAIALYNAIVPPALNAIAAFINAHGDQIQTIFSGAWNVIKGIITIALALIGGILKTALQLIQGDWSGAWETVRSTAAAVWEGIQTTVSGAVQAVIGVFGLLGDAVYNVLKPGIAAAEGIISPIVGWFNNISAAVSSVIGWVRDLINTLNSVSVPDWLQGHSPPPMAEWFDYIGASAARAGAAIPQFQASLASAAVNTSAVTIGSVNTYAAPGQNADQVANTTVRLLGKQLRLRRV